MKPVCNKGNTIGDMDAKRILKEPAIAERNGRLVVIDVSPRTWVTFCVYAAEESGGVLVRDVEPIAVLLGSELKSLLVGQNILRGVVYRFLPRRTVKVRRVSKRADTGELSAADLTDMGASCSDG